jgi:alpha-1,3-rhamnosyltransferase
MENQPLVSIVVITYNSSQFVEETLDSALAQTYPNIEIIISDDCSTDNTVEVCRKWISIHKDCGRSIRLIEAEKNTGVAGNCNRGLAASKGIWIKPIAGDDMLIPDAIESYVRFVNNNPNISVVFARIIVFKGDYPNYNIYVHPVFLKYYFYYNTRMTSKRQFRILSKIFVGSGPASFIRTEAIRSVNGFDERFPLQEDYPLYIKLAKNGYKFYFLDKVTVKWRKNVNSITNDRKKGVIFNSHNIRLFHEYKYVYKMENLNFFWRWLLKFSLFLQNNVLKSGNNTKSRKSVFYYNLYRAIDPFLWYGRICINIDRIMEKHYKQC